MSRSTDFTRPVRAAVISGFTFRAGRTRSAPARSSASTIIASPVSHASDSGLMP
jgi:hypothetical protein